jgi:nucleotide-binding universal stress UspA family protein
LRVNLPPVVVAALGGTRYGVHGKRRSEKGMEMSFFPRSILLAVDGSEEARLATQAATELSKATGSDLHVVYVLPSAGELIGPHSYPADRRKSLLEGAERDARAFLDEQAERIGSEGGKVTEAHLRVGQADKEVVRISDELDVGMIVLGSRGLGAVRRALMGSVSDSVVRHAHCPVFVVRGDEER